MKSSIKGSPERTSAYRATSLSNLRIPRNGIYFNFRKYLPQGYVPLPALSPFFATLHVSPQRTSRFCGHVKVLANNAIALNFLRDCKLSTSEA